MSISSNVKPGHTITTVGQLLKVLQYFPEDTQIVMVENRYRGGGDEYFETEIVLAEAGDVLIISPVEDAGIGGTLLNLNEL